MPGQRFWLFENGAAEWLRWVLAILFGAGIVYGGLHAKIESLDQKLDDVRDNAQSLNEEVRQDLRELRSLHYTGSGSEGP